MKTTYFKNWSTITMIDSLPLTFGYPLMKFIEMEAHVCSTIQIGCSKPTFFLILVLLVEPTINITIHGLTSNYSGSLRVKYQTHKDCTLRN